MAAGCRLALPARRLPLPRRTRRRAARRFSPALTGCASMAAGCRPAIRLPPARDRRPIEPVTNVPRYQRRTAVPSVSRTSGRGIMRRVLSGTVPMVALLSFGSELHAGGRAESAGSFHPAVDGHDPHAGAARRFAHPSDDARAEGAAACRRAPAAAPDPANRPKGCGPRRGRRHIQGITELVILTVHGDQRQHRHHRRGLQAQPDPGWSAVDQRGRPRRSIPTWAGNGRAPRATKPGMHGHQVLLGPR